MTLSGEPQAVMGRRARLRARGRQLLVATTLACVSLWSSAQEHTPLALDGLHSTEKTRALQALSREASAATGLSQARSARGTAGALPTEPTEPVLLLMERRRIKGSSQRLADAWYYSYPRNETTHKIIDLTTGSVRSSEIVIDMQLPLIEAEISRAFDIVLASVSDRASLANAYRQVTGSDFTDRSQVSYKAFVFHPDTVVDGLEPDARRCGLHRCAQMLLYTHDNVSLDMSPVVDLSTSRVLQNLELRAQAIVRREEAAL